MTREVSPDAPCRERGTRNSTSEAKKKILPAVLLETHVAKCIRIRPTTHFSVARQDDGEGPSTASPIGPSAPSAEERKSWGSPASIMDGVREARIVIWSTSQQRKLSQEECPLPAELAIFLDEMLQVPYHTSLTT